MSNFNDVSICGNKKVNGGKYRHVKITGNGKITGDTEAKEININGSGKIEGNTVTSKIEINGTGLIEGNLESKQVISDGELIIRGVIIAENILTNGMLSVQKMIKAKKIKARGNLYSSKGLESEEFNLEGAFKIEELLNSNKIDILFSGNCYAKEIGGDEILIRHTYTFDFGFTIGCFGINDRMEAELIEGNTVFIEYTKVKVVRGHNIKIGKNCVIEEVEYFDSIEIDPGAIVKTKKKI